MSKTREELEREARKFNDENHLEEFYVSSDADYVFTFAAAFVAPLEREIADLRAKLAAAEGRIRSLEETEQRLMSKGEWARLRGVLEEKSRLHREAERERDQRQAKIDALFSDIELAHYASWIDPNDPPPPRNAWEGIKGKCLRAVVTAIYELREQLEKAERERDEALGRLAALEGE